ncbi:MAG: multiubiquitin domain-containing protein [Desulfovibrionaceae bacterium]
MSHEDKLHDENGPVEKHPDTDNPHSHPPGGGSILMADENMALIPVAIDLPHPTGRQVLAAAGCLPPEEHALIQLLRPGTQLIGLEENVALREQEDSIFRAFRGGEVYLFTIDEHDYQWGASEICESALRYLAVVPDDKVLVLMLDEKEREVKDGEPVHLAHKGVEHLRTKPKLATVTIDGAEKTIPSGVYTTEELIQILGVEPGYLLNVMRGEQLVTLRPGEKVHVKNGMVFISQVPGGASS